METLFTALDSGATVLTASRHLARHLADAYDRDRATRAGCWPGADVLPYAAWLERTWEEGLDAGAWEGEGPPMLLSATQETALWEGVVEESEAGGALLQLPAAARRAREAWGLLAAWRCRLEAHQTLLDADAEALLRWGVALRRRLARYGWLDSATLPDRLIAAFHDGRLKAPAHVVLAGFDEFDPQQEALQEALRAAGTGIEVWRPQAGPGAAVRLDRPDTAHELEAAARWVRGLLEGGAAGPIGLVVPDLAHNRAAVERVLERILRPGAGLPGAAGGHRPYHLSLGVPLAEVPVVRAALQVLALARGAVPLEEAGALLRSPFLAGHPVEAYARARLDARLRRRGVTTVSIALLRGLAMRTGEGWEPCPRLAAGLARLEARADPAPRRAAPADWARLWARRLAALGWPGGRGLDSAEYQAVEAFRDLLSTFAGLGEVTGALSAERALTHIAQLARERVFQPAEEAPAPVRVMGLLEAAGLRFTHLWITGLHDEAWPAAPDPNPFLPVTLQRRLGMPHADAARELAYAARVTDRLLASAPRVVVSHAQRDADRELRPSPLIASLPEAAPGSLPASPVVGYARRLRDAAPEPERRIDEQAPPPADAEAVAGGSALFRDQAACPFRAFARHRLAARALEQPAPGLDPRERGTLVHRVLEEVWAGLGSQAALCAEDPAALRDRVTGVVDGVLASFAARARSGLGKRFLDLERRRLVQLLLEWLALEAQRPPFIVEAQERARRVEFGGLEVNLRPDRLDRLPDGRRVVIDYKTGEARPAAWLDERPDDPQLLLYGAALQGDAHTAPAAALVFASLKPGRLGFAGFAEEEGLLPGVGPPKGLPGAAAGDPADDWAAWLADRRRVLVRLAGAFRSGDAAVDPKRPGETCRYCELPALCRVLENEAGGAGGKDGR